MQRPTILILDDEEKLRGLMAQILELEGFDVYQAGTWKAAQKRLEHHAVDVVLCDVKLPDEMVWNSHKPSSPNIHTSK